MILAIAFNFLALWIILWFIDRTEASDPGKVFLVMLGVTAANIGIALGLGSIVLLALPALLFVDAILFCWWLTMPFGKGLWTSGLLLAANILFNLGLNALTAPV